MALSDAIFSIRDETDFNQLSLEVFNFQKEHCEVYAKYLQVLGAKLPRHYSEIPCIPIQVFKNQEVLSGRKGPSTVFFLSSGTSDSNRSKHLVLDTTLYRKSFTIAYQKFIGLPSDQVILALLPNYLEQGDSSLVFMVKALIEQSLHPLSGFLLGNFEEVSRRYEQALTMGKKVVLIGVSYALLDLALANIRLPEAVIIETGGMKGRRAELSKEQLHSALKFGLGVDKVYAEYGMTELLSQAYCLGEELIFTTPPWMKVLIREINDPLQMEESGRTGGLNVIDLANVNSCSFIATQDLARLEGDGFQLMGRFDTSDVRGCNLMVE